MLKPILKWAGGKTQLLPELSARLPSYINAGKPYAYIEPFCGGAALAWHLLQSSNPPQKIWLNDANTDLINVYTVIKTQPDALITALETIQGEYDSLTSQEAKKPYYYEKREQFNSRQLDAVQHASLFIFLNRAGFNGLYRVNKKNEFNVPIGSYRQPNFLFPQIILALHTALQAAALYSGDYRQCLDTIKNYQQSGLPVFVYLDPPYRPISATASFTSYGEGGFDDDCQRELAAFCATISRIGCDWMLSNSDPKNINPADNFFDDLYSSYRIERIQASRMINSKAADRGKINELLIRNF